MTAIKSFAGSTGSAPSAAQGQWRVVTAALVGLAALVLAAGLSAGMRQGLLALIGFAGGMALYHASFGFTSAWRRMLTDQRSVGLRAQLVMLALTIAVFFPLLDHGVAFGQPLAGFVSPIGLALGVGAFLFGIGMQLGGGCGSGTLYAAGGGNLRMLLTLTTFICGSLIATADPLGWTHWPNAGAFSIVEAVGGWTAVVVALALLAICYHAVLRLELARHRHAEPMTTSWTGDLVRGPWPLLAGAGGLAVVNVATLIVAGRPWGITSAFALWGAKIAAALGFGVAGWTWWHDNPALTDSVFTDVTSVMDLGLMLGALAAAGLATRFAPAAKLPWRSLLAAIIGGLLMGLGARLATGCNIGAFFSGIASGSLHGVVWLAAAVPGNMIGVRLRPLFGLSN